MDIRIGTTNLPPPGRQDGVLGLAPANSEAALPREELDVSKDQRVEDTGKPAELAKGSANAEGEAKATSSQQVDQMAKALIRVLEGDVDDLESQSTLSKLNEIMRDRDRDLQFLVDDSTGKNVLKVLHSQSQEVIRQFPSEEVLRVAQFIIEGSPGLVDDQA